jgi:hypothetical protein
MLHVLNETNVSFFHWREDNYVGSVIKLHTKMLYKSCWKFGKNCLEIFIFKNISESGKKSTCIYILYTYYTFLLPSGSSLLDKSKFGGKIKTHIPKYYFQKKIVSLRFFGDRAWRKRYCY